MDIVPFLPEVILQLRKFHEFGWTVSIQDIVSPLPKEYSLSTANNVYLLSSFFASAASIVSSKAFDVQFVLHLNLKISPMYVLKSVLHMELLFSNNLTMQFLYRDFPPYR